jgi:class 3 adenylate cyclase/tetratricopeptide (TPR) repeat protein
MRDVAQNVARFDKWIGPLGWTATRSAFGVAGGIASHVLNCSNCGHENPDGAKFCNECATPLDTATVRLVAQERKVVTCLFCDLVGFTATSESADPEDVDKMLGAYFAMARTAIEAFGGTVQKFIGDAVVGVFGVPAAHEDDPERAVRAGLRICEEAEELTSVGGAPLKLRVGINTGEALVRLGVSAASGEGFLTGDSINTASRIQSVAPEMGVGVGLATYEATFPVFDYEELEPATLKGKSVPVRIFRPKSPKARLGTDLTRTQDTPFVGREIDLALLKGVFEKTVAAASPQLVTVVGEPGLGKSRIVAELLGYIDTKQDLITWRQGRCLPYGEGITFWALGEILKAHAGILESDPPDVATSKLDTVLPEGDERPWFRQRLLPLLGIEATSTAEREELFTAWRRFFEHVAGHDPTVLVFEDLHWADDAMLSFLEHLADRVEGVPLLVIGTARPELFERHPDYGNGLLNLTPITLAPLSEEETARLVSALLETTVIPADLQQPILDRAGGNPLYAEEFVRLLKDKDLVVRKGSSWELKESAEVPFPDSVQALIAARLDTLSADTKSILADAAVIGKVFWAGAIAQMGERDLTAVTDTLSELSRKELVRPARRSSIEGEAEYAFWHILARDVAYRQLPRASRASRHVAAARWVESKAPERIEDLADVLAYHYSTALELARAAAQTEQAQDLEAPALRFLSLAGERALGLDTSAALSNLERALALAPEGHSDRPEALARFGEAAFQAGRLAEASEALDEAIASFRARGDLPAAATLMGTLGKVLGRLGDPRTWTLPAEALVLLEPLGPSPELIAALTEVAVVDALQGRSEDAIRVADRALVLAEELDKPRPARALGCRGLARADLGDPAGLEDYRGAIELATEEGQGREAALLHNNLGVTLSAFEGPAASLEVLRQGIAYAKPRGLTEMLDSLTQSTLDALVDTGAHEEALILAAELVPRLEASGDVFDLISARAAEARILALRGEGAKTAEVLDWLEPMARGTEDPQIVVSALGSSAPVRAGLGQDEAAVALLAELESYPSARDNPNYPVFLPAIVRTALGMGETQLAERLVSGLDPRYPYAEHSLVAANAALTEAHGDQQAAAGDYAEAAIRWERFGVLPEQGFALLGQGRCLLRISGSIGAASVLQHAREIFKRLRAAPALAQTDALLASAA